MHILTENYLEDIKEHAWRRSRILIELLLYFNSHSSSSAQARLFDMHSATYESNYIQNLLQLNCTSSQDNPHIIDLLDFVSLKGVSEEQAAFIEVLKRLMRFLYSATELLQECVEVYREHYIEDYTSLIL